ncbi:hypothetical protein [Microbulbifer sp. PSTR4-B]|uniref:hypothetical protein n=1 Tax=unclassified Microbulbifer TaxID=2619833 RepID=UPI00403A9A53
MEQLWTPEDLQAVKDAIMKLVSGKRAVTIKFSGGNTTKEASYAPADLPQLKRLHSEIRRELQRAAGASGSVTTVTSKGF